MHEALERSLRGGLAGGVAAAVWAAQLPLSGRVLRTSFSDVELLGKLITRGPAWRPLGVLLHVQNGVLFGAAYAHVAPRLRLPPWARGPAAALTENFALWPLAAVSDRWHPARDELQPVFASPRALAQATWCHLLFGVVLGELERRLNQPRAAPESDHAEVASHNGHFGAAVRAAAH